VIDEIIQVKNEDAFETGRQRRDTEGLLSRISSGLPQWASISLQNALENKGNIVVISLIRGN